MSSRASMPQRSAAPKSAAPLRVQCRKPAPKSKPDPWEEEAEELAAWLARSRATPHGSRSPTAVHPVPLGRDGWGKPLDESVAARALREPGRPLEPGVREDFEQHLGRDLSDVRVHDDGESRALTRTLGAEAFTLGQHIFTTSADRELLAHEVVHTVQQARDPAAPQGANRIQASFDHTTAALDPKVEILLDLHLRKKGKKLKAIADDKLLGANSWWRKFRTAVESKDATKPPNFEAEVQTALGKIDEYKALDTDGNDPIQNGVAAVLADYLRLNEAWDLAAKVVVAYPWSGTAVPADQVFNALMTTKGRGPAAMIPFPRIWSTSAPEGYKVEATWTSEITTVIDQFVKLPPLEEHRKTREALRDRLKARLATPKGSENPPSDPLPFDRLTAASSSVTSELDVFARFALDWVRGTWSGALTALLNASADSADTTPIQLWQEDINDLDIRVSLIGTDKDPALQLTDGDYLLPVIKAAQARLATELGPVVQAHSEFWAGVHRKTLTDTPGKNDLLLAQTLGERTYGDLFFSAGNGALAAELKELAPILGNAVVAYLDLFDGGPIPDLEQRDSIQEVLKHEAENAAVFRETIAGAIQIPLTQKLHKAQTDGKADLSQGLGWVAKKMETLREILGQVQPRDKDTSPATWIEDWERRFAIAYDLWKIARDALGKTGADVTRLTQPPEKRQPVPGRENVPAAQSWQRIMDRTEEAMVMADLHTSLLVLPNEFQPSEKSDGNQLRKDLGAVVVRGLEPFTGNELALFYDRVYHQALKEELTAVNDVATALETAPNVPKREKESLWLVQHAYDSLKARTGRNALPQRYESRGAYWRRYFGDPPRSFGTLLQQNATTGKFVAKYQTDWNWIVSSDVSPDTQGDAWAWTLPLPSELVAPLYQISLLRGIGSMSDSDLASHLSAAGPAEAKDAGERRAEAIRDLAAAAGKLGATIAPGVAPAKGYFAWYEALNERVRAIHQALGKDFLATEATEKVRADVAQTLTAQKTGEEYKSAEERRRATTLDRAVIARINAELLEKFADNATLNFPALGKALDNIDAFRAAVRPERTEHEVEGQSAALLLDNADWWVKAFNERLDYGGNRLHLLVSEALENFDRLLTKPTATGQKPEDLATHGQGIAWNTEAQRTALETTIKTVRPSFENVLLKMKGQLAPYHWQLGISARRGSDELHGEITSHLGGKAVRTFASIHEENLAQKDEAKRVPELIPVSDVLAVKIVAVHQDFTFLPGIGDRANASSKERHKHALYQPARVFLGVAAKSAADLGTATAEEDPTLDLEERKKKDQGAALVDVEIWENGAVFSTFTVYAGDLEGSRGGLNWLAGVVHNETNRQKFEDLGHVLETFGQGLMLAASVFPPTAAAAAAAEVIGFLLEILANPDFKQTLEAVTKDPYATVEHAAKELKAQFTIDRLFDLLLNGNFEPDRFLGASTLRVTKPSSRLAAGSLTKLVTRMKRVGAVFAVRLEQFQETVEGPVFRAEHLMGEHPRVATIVEWLADHLDQLDDPEGMVLRHPIIGPIYEAYMLYRLRNRDTGEGSTIGLPLPEVAKNIQGALDNMVHFELPATIVPLDLAIEALVNVALKLAPKGGGKVGIAVRLAQMLEKGLQSTGANTVVYGFLAEQITDTWADPNRYWQRDVVPLLTEPLRGAIQSAADDIGKHLRQAPLIGDYFGNDRVKNAVISIPANERAAVPNGKLAENAKVEATKSRDGDFDSAAVAARVPGESAMTEKRELKFSDVSDMPDSFFKGIQKKSAAPAANTPAGQAPGGSPSPTPAGLATRGPAAPSAHATTAYAGNGGAPLAPAQRHNAERKFGHDFSHVRLHHGPAAWPATGARGVDALTSGSHVFLRPDLSPGSGRGQKVMDHELAHVLQKTAGSAAPAQPRGGGIRWRPDEEAAANRMADRAGHNHTGRAVPIEGRHRDGASPAVGRELMQHFFKRLSSPAAGATLSQTIDRAHARGPADAHDDTLARAGGLWKSIHSALSGTLPVAGHFKGALDPIKKHLANRLDTLMLKDASMPAVSKIIGHLAARNEKDPPAPDKPPEGKPAAEPGKPTFDARAFLAELSLYITGRSGIVLDFDLSAAEVKRLETNAHAEVTVATKVKHIELLFVSTLTDPGSKLWAATVANTVWTRNDDEKRRRDALGKVLEADFHAAAPESTTSTSGAGNAKPQSFPSPGSYTPIWDTSKADLALNSSYRDKVEAYLQPAELGPELMPVWGYFSAPATTTFKSLASGDTTQIEKNAVHWKDKTHHDLTGGSYFLDAHKRNSHHLIQYLLPEYFANIKEFQPFPKLTFGRTYPGVTNTGARADVIAGDSQSIGVKATEAGRGGAMPAILISATTHQNAGLHVTPTPDDSPKAAASQGWSIHRQFRPHLTASVKKHLGVTREGDALDDYLVGLGKNHVAGQKAVVEAVRQTYAWIKTENEPNLVAPEGMPGREADFYISQFRNDKAAFKKLNDVDFDTDSMKIRQRVQASLEAAGVSAMAGAIKRLEQAPLGWVLP